MGVGPLKCSEPPEGREKDVDVDGAEDEDVSLIVHAEEVLSSASRPLNQERTSSRESAGASSQDLSVTDHPASPSKGPRLPRVRQLSRGLSAATRGLSPLVCCDGFQGGLKRQISGSSTSASSGVMRQISSLRQSSESSVGVPAAAKSKAGVRRKPLATIPVSSAPSLLNGIPPKPKARAKAKRRRKTSDPSERTPSREESSPQMSMSPSGNSQLSLGIDAVSDLMGMPCAKGDVEIALEATQKELRNVPRLEEALLTMQEVPLPAWTRMSGWLMKKKGIYRPMALARATAGRTGSSLFWKRGYFQLGSELLRYSDIEPSTRDGAIGGTLHTGAYALSDIDGVAVSGKDIIIHFSTSQRTGKYKRAREYLCLRAPSTGEAEQWGKMIRISSAARLREKLPREWDVSAMLHEEGKDGKTVPVRLVSEVSLPHASVLAVQRLLDHTFICKRTRDRRDGPTPVRLEVAEVIQVQNSAAWIKYSKARSWMKSGADSDLLQPGILTATHGDHYVSTALGQLDDSSNEHWLFHGSSSAGVEGIAHRDFKLELAGTHRGTLYGKGVYLAECCSKADEYAYEENGLCRMLICRAALGRILVDQSPRPAAAELASKCKVGYDSLCGDRWTAVGTYREFVLYNMGQVYPAFIILYRRVGQAQLLQAIGHAADRHDLRTACRLVVYAAKLAETHPDHVVRYRILMLLAARAMLVVPALTECLHDERRGMRKFAAAALGKIGAHMSPAVAGLAEASDVCKGVAGASVPELSESLKDPCADVRKAAVVALQQFGMRAVPAVSALREGLQDTSPGVRQEAARCLGQLGGNASSALPALTEQLKDDAAGARAAAAIALGSLAGIDAQNAATMVQAIADALVDPSTEVREACCEALGKLGPPAASPKALAGLMSCLEDTADAVRQSSATALGQFGSQASSSLTQLQTCLHDDSAGVRAAAAASLGCLGTESARAVQALKHSLKDTDPSVSSAAAVALGRIAATPGCAAKVESAVQPLSRCLKETDTNVRVAAATALGHFGPSITRALPALTERIKDSSPDVRKAAAGALCMLGEHAAPALPALNEFLNDLNEDARRSAQTVIFDITRRMSSEEIDSASDSGGQQESYFFLSYYKYARGTSDPCKDDPWKDVSDSGESEGGLL